MNYTKEQNDYIKNNILIYLIKPLTDIVFDYVEMIIIKGTMINMFNFATDIDQVIINNDKIYTSYLKIL